MNVNTILARLDDVLIPLGFNRKKRRWNRRVGPFIDVVDVQTNKAGDLITINAGVLNNNVHEACWGTSAPAVAEVTSCTVQIRIGQIVDLKDIWWPLSVDGTPLEMANTITAYLLPFLERMHSRSEMELYLIAQDVEQKNYPLPIIHLAILMYQGGDKVGASEMLSGLHRKCAGAWQKRIAEVRSRLGGEISGE